MSVNYMVKAIYDEQIHDVTKSAEKWKDVLRLAGNLYRFEFDNILMIYAQKPHSTLCADYDTWKKVDRFVKRGSKGIAIFPSRALNPRMKYVFDISDTGGRNRNLTWSLDGNNLKDYLDFLVSEGQLNQYEVTDRNTMMTSLKDFTKTEIRGIIEVEFEERMSEFNQLSGSVIKEFFTKRKGLPEDMDTAEQFVAASVLYVVGTRCGFDLSVSEQDFSQIVNISDEDMVYRLGSLVCDVSCSVLRGFSCNLKIIENERSMSHGRDGINVLRSGRTTVSGYPDAGGTELNKSGEIRKNGKEVPEGERTSQIQDTLPIRDVRREDEGSGRGSEQSSGSADGELSHEAQTTESIIHDGNVEVKGTGEDAGRGSSAESGSIDVPLEDEELYDEEKSTSSSAFASSPLQASELAAFNRELDELNSFGNNREAEYHQASFFDADFGLAGQNDAELTTVKKSGNSYEYRGQKFTYLEPKKELVVPHEFVVYTLLRGSGFENGRTRICQIFQNEIDAGTRAKLIKKEYGQGGAGWPIEGYGLHGYDSFHAQGLRFQWRDEEGEKEGYVSWKNVEKEIGVLILTGEYQPERNSMDESTMDGDREDAIDAEFREVESEEHDVLDDFAIPDEPESYESERIASSSTPEELTGMTPEELAEEDRMVTMAEYGAEMAAETDHAPEDTEPEALAVVPTDYGKLIAEMDEDKRDAMEILVTDCSIYTPFKAFLQDLASTENLLMPNRLEFLSKIVLGDREERKGYCNNKYGLVEYVMKPFKVQMSLKNRHGERVTETTGYRELYEVLTYMAKQPFYCGEDQKARYNSMMQGELESLSPIYQEFKEKQQEFLENNEKQRNWNTETNVVDSQTASAQTDDKDTENVEDAETSKVLEPDDTKSNFHYNLWEVPKGGAKTRYQWNVDAINTLKKIEAEGRLATSEEQKILANYVGWGGLSQAFDDNNASWKKEYDELKTLLSEEEYTAARATVNNAFYTAPEVASCISQALVQFGFRGGNVLEPSMGIGNFFGTLPTPLQRSNLYGVELDSISGRIAGQLYQKANISITGFEKTTYPDNFFDAVIGNVPFGDYKIFDPKYNKYNFRIHDYFIAKALDQVRPGGIVAVITTKGTLDKSNPTIRKYLAERAELVGAVRLPNTAFKESAGTEVTSDILFLQKRERKIDIEPDWVHLGYTENGIAVNSYFVEHPEMMLGHMELDDRIYGKDSRYTVCVNDDENFNMYEALNHAIHNIRAEMTDFDRVAEAEEVNEDVIPANPDVRNFTYTFFEGKLYYRENSEMVRQNMSQAAEDRIRLMDEIRQVTRELIDIQMEGCSDEELAEKQRVLNKKYDSFVEKYGVITGKGNRIAFRDDSDYPLLCSLEEVNEDGEVRKADMFYKQTIKAKTVIERVETAVEALNVSVNEFGAVNIPYMLSIYEPDITSIREEVAKKEGTTADEVGFSEDLEVELKRAALVQELEGLIFLNPANYNENNPNTGWETSDEYLSGNVRDKLRVAKAAVNDDPRFAINIESLEKMQPVDIEASDIDVRIGTTWIEPTDYEEFIYDLLNTPRRARAVRSQWYNTGIQVHLNKLSMDWFIENKSMDKHSVASTKTYGTSRMDAYSIFEDTLNLKTVTVRDRVDDGDGKYHYVVNKNETMLAREKQSQMKEKFKDWLFSNPERRAKYVEYYNETFNNSRLREYDGSHLQFPGMNPEIELKPHQKNAVARILLGGNTLLAHCVGAGKSFEMMAACMEQKRLGLANKTVLVVPKPLIGQTASEFLRLYPSANILVATERDFEKSRRKQFVSRIATGDYDAIIMSHSQFEKIPISAERKERMLNEQISEITYAIDDMKSQNGERWTVKQMEAQKKKLEEQLKSLTDESRKDDLITFEELGVDSIMVDEAHNFKNLAIFSKMNNVSGISSSGAKKSTDMQLKCQYLSEINNGRGIVFATGTPINTL